MGDSIFIDTNLWVYLYAKNPDLKYQKIQQTIDANFDCIIISTQILGELYHVLTRKNLCPKEESKEIIIDITTTFPIVGIDEPNVLKALDINERYGYSYWDSLVIATALLNDCHQIHSEDMQHNQLIEHQTRILNPLID